MTMLDILDKRLPDGLTIVEAKEKPSKFLIKFGYNGDTASAELVKTCAPGKENIVCDTTIQVAMTALMLDKGDLEGAKYWKDYAKRASSDKEMGRPKPASYSQNELSVRFDEETSELLLAVCERLRISKGEAVRRGIKKLAEEVCT